MLVSHFFYPATVAIFDQRRIKTYLSLEEIYRVQGKWNERTRYLSALREQALKSNNGFWVASALLRTARFDYDAGHLNRALGVARLAESTAAETPYATEPIP